MAKPSEVTSTADMGKILAYNTNGDDTFPILRIEYPQFLPSKIIIYNTSSFYLVDKNITPSIKHSQNLTTKSSSQYFEPQWSVHTQTRVTVVK